MTRIHVRGFQIFTDRHGKLRCYHRKTREPVDLAKHPLGSAEFFAECARIASLTKAAAEPKAGTLGKLIAAYKASPSFQDLAEQTRADYAKCFDYLKPIDGTALVRFDRPLVVRIRDRAAEKRNRRFANYVKACLSLVFAWGSERGYIASNPAAGIKDLRRKKGAPEANRPWSDHERHAVLEALPDHVRPAVALMMFTGLGPKDALTLPRSFRKAGEIATRRAKTGHPVFWPEPSILTHYLDSAPKHDAVTLLANSRGTPWTLSGFNSVWLRVRARLEADEKVGPGLTLYGLRHTVAVILRESGYDERTIADALGQKTIEMARRYARGADLGPKMRAVVTSFDAELNKRRTRAVKPD